MYDHNPGAHSNEEVGNDSGCRKRTHFGLMDSLRFASWMSQAFFMIVVNMSPRGMPSVHSISLSPPRPWPFVNWGDLRARMEGPWAGCSDCGTAWK